MSTRNFPSKASFAMAYGVLVLVAFALAFGAVFFFDCLAFAVALALAFAEALAQREIQEQTDRISQPHTVIYTPVFFFYFNGMFNLSACIFFTSFSYHQKKTK